MSFHEQARLPSQLPLDGVQKAVITIMNACHPSHLSHVSCFICQIRRLGHNARWSGMPQALLVIFMLSPRDPPGNAMLDSLAISG